MRSIGLVAIGNVVLLLAGCASTRITDTPRSAVEMLLVSTAVDRAAQAMELGALKDRRAFLDVTPLESIDKGYVTGTLRDALGRAGVLLVGAAADAEVTVEARCGALAIDKFETMIGLPATPVPIPGVGTVTLPEIPLYKRVKQEGIGKFALQGFDQATRKQILSTGPVSGRAYLTRYQSLMCHFRTSDVPEKHFQFRDLLGKEEAEQRVR